MTGPLLVPPLILYLEGTLMKLLDFLRRKPSDAGTRADVMVAAMALAKAIRAREGFLAAEPGRDYELSRTRIAHRKLEQVATDFGPDLGFDVTPLSGGGRKD
jgi:hypothetical protein